MSEPAPITEYCCEAMARWSQPCERGDQPIHHTAIANIPGIRLLDRCSCVVITFCPWCGKQIFDDTGLGGIRMWLREIIAND